MSFKTECLRQHQQDFECRKQANRKQSLRGATHSNGRVEIGQNLERIRGRSGGKNFCASAVGFVSQKSRAIRGERSDVEAGVREQFEHSKRNHHIGVVYQAASKLVRIHVSGVHGGKSLLTSYA